jgi:hypothetical protein
VLYTGLEFGLLFLAFLLDSRPDFFPLVRSNHCNSQLSDLSASRSPDCGRIGIYCLPGDVVCTVCTAPAKTRTNTRVYSQYDFDPEAECSSHLWTCLLFILLLVNALLAERQSREKLLLANDRLRQYALRIEDQATLQERNRIAREIHDARLAL